MLTIKSDKLKLSISLIGAEKLSLQTNDGLEYLHQRASHWDSTAPFLFPIVGRLKDGYTKLDNLLLEMPIHGFLRNQKFEVLQHKEDELTLVNIHNEETLKMFPYLYKVFITYQLKDLTVVTQIRVTNHSIKVMPFNIGAHPGIRLPLYEGESFNDYSLFFDQTEKFNSPYIEADGTINYTKTAYSFKNLKKLDLNYNYFENDAIIIPRVKSGKLDLVNKDHQGVSFSFNNFISLAFWTRPGAPFLCIEPWVGHGDRYDSKHNFLEKDNLLYLKPTENFVASYSITILE